MNRKLIHISLGTILHLSVECETDRQMFRIVPALFFEQNTLTTIAQSLHMNLASSTLELNFRSNEQLRISKIFFFSK